MCVASPPLPDKDRYKLESVKNKNHFPATRASRGHRVSFSRILVGLSMVVTGSLSSLYAMARADTHGEIGERKRKIEHDEAYRGFG